MVMGNISVGAGVYSAQSVFGTKSNTVGKYGVSSGETNNTSVQDKRRLLNGTSSGNATSQSTQTTGIEAILQDTKNYSASLQTQRQSASSTSNKIKKLKYQFKNLSVQILRSKTSMAARKAASQARREVLRLKNERQTGEYDSDEIEAAIAHAKAMERVAKKKAAHLQEEEMAKASGGICADAQVDAEEKKTEEAEDSEFDENAEDLEDYEGEYDDYSGYADEADLQELLGTYGNWSTSLGDISDMINDMSELSEEMYDTMSESMKEMLEEMGFDELSESLEVAKGDMDPADLKAMKIKHRNKEMKDIVKADSDYLKAMFNHLEKSKGSSAIPGMSGGQTVVASSPALTVSTVNLAAVAAAASSAASGGAESVIDVAL
jgi:hypothetical protein